MIYQSTEDFKKAFEEYQNITAQYQQGQVDASQYHQKITKLQGKDIFGQEWAIDGEHGHWVMLQNGDWREADPESFFSESVATNPTDETKKKKRRWPVATIIGLVLVSCLCISALGIGVYSYYSGDLAWLLSQFGIDFQVAKPSSDEVISEDNDFLEDISDFSLDIQDSKTLSPGQIQILDAYQAKALFPLESLDEGSQGQVVVSEPNASLKEALDAFVEMKSLFYQFTTDGENDGKGSAQFSLPSTGESLFFLEIFDEKYFSLSPLPASTGEIKLNIPVRAVTQDEGNDSISFKGSYSFGVVSPRVDASQKPGVIMARYKAQADVRDCGISQVTQSQGYMQNPTYLTTQICRKNPNNTVKAIYYPPNTPKISNAQVDQMVDLVTQIMAVYKNEGFIRANLENYWSGVSIIVNKGKGDPYYSVGNGTIYIPEDSLGHENLEYELAHELAHWIQDEEYNMGSAYWKNKLGISESQTWWLENSAENMVMLYKPDYIDRNLTTFGPPNPSDSKTPFQFAPLRWNDQLYLHAQLLKVFTCENAAVCPINQTKFKEAINQGTYPFDAGAVELVSKNLKEYARYLLGKSPQQANNAIYLMPSVISGKGFGDFAAPKIEKNVSSFQMTGYKPQLKLVGGGGEEELHIEAALDKGAVYPLTVGSPTNINSEGNPVVIEVEPGTPFYYRLGDGDIIFADGNSKVILGPVHSTLDIDKIRIVAVAGDGAKVFKAKVKSVNLEGDWLFLYEAMLVDNLVCDDPEGVSEMTNEQFAQFTALLTSFPAAASGKYIRDTAGTSYTWDGNSNYIPSLDEVTDVVWTIQGASLVSPQGIVVDSSFSSHMLGASKPQGDGLLAFLSLGVLGMVFVNRRNKFAFPLVVLFLIIFISACGAGFNFEADMHTITKLDHMESAAGKTLGELIEGADKTSANAQLSPLYVSKGESVSTINYTATIGVSVMGEEQESKVTCSGTLTYRVNGFLFEDGLITETFLGDGE